MSDIGLWNEVINDQILRNIDAVKKTTAPLRELFGVDYFTYHRISNEGHYSVLLDRPDWAEHYVSEKLYLQDPYLGHPEAYNSGFCLVDMHGTPSYKEIIIQEGLKFNMDLGITLIQKMEDGVEFFGFSGSKHTSALNKLYLNHQSLLLSFASHFKEQHTITLKNLEEVALSLAILKGKKLERKSVQPQLNDDSLHTFLKAIGLSQQIAYTAQLSRREKQCLKCLLNGKSSKETAALLGLGTRTIESYFENIKRKLDCWGKNEIFSIAQKLESLGLLP